MPGRYELILETGGENHLITRKRVFTISSTNQKADIFVESTGKTEALLLRLGKLLLLVSLHPIPVFDSKSYKEKRFHLATGEMVLQLGEESVQVKAVSPPLPPSRRLFTPTLVLLFLSLLSLGGGILLSGEAVLPECSRPEVSRKEIPPSLTTPGKTPPPGKINYWDLENALLSCDRDHLPELKKSLLLEAKILEARSKGDTARKVAGKARGVESLLRRRFTASGRGNPR